MNGLVAGASATLTRQHAGAGIVARAYERHRTELLAALERDPTAKVDTPTYRKGELPAHSALFLHLTDAHEVVICGLLVQAANEGDALAALVLETATRAHAECHANAAAEG
jgi:hypothetical protein